MSAKPSVWLLGDGRGANVTVRLMGFDEWLARYQALGAVYFFLDYEKGHVKIGHSKDPSRRIRQFRTGRSDGYKLVYHGDWGRACRV